MTAARWCDRCKAYKEQPHDHPESPSLFDAVEEQHEELMKPAEPVTEDPDYTHGAMPQPWAAGRVDPGPFDLEEGKRQRDQGIATVQVNEDEEYKVRFETVVRDLTGQGLNFNSEDVIARIGMPPHHPNTVGALTRSMAVKYGYVKVGYIKATRTRRHAGLIAVWGKA